MRKIMGRSEIITIRRTRSLLPARLPLFEFSVMLYFSFVLERAREKGESSNFIAVMRVANKNYAALMI